MLLLLFMSNENNDNIIRASKLKLIEQRWATIAHSYNDELQMGSISCECEFGFEFESLNVLVVAI